MRVLPVVQRAMQYAVLALGGGVFNGKIEATLLPVDIGTKLTFNANVKVFQDATNFVTYTPCDDNGKIKTFSNADDLVNWLKGAYLDIISLSMTIADFDLVTRAFVPPTDVLSDATKKKTYFTKKKDGLSDNLIAANLEVSRAATAGWNAPTAHQALQANYAELVAKRDAITASQAYYTAQIAFYQAIITP